MVTPSSYPKQNWQRHAEQYFEQKEKLCSNDKKKQMMQNMKRKHDRRNIAKRSVQYNDKKYYAQYSDFGQSVQNKIHTPFTAFSEIQSTISPVGLQEEVYANLPMTCFQAKQLQLMKPRRASIISEENLNYAMRNDKIKSVRSKQRMLVRNSTFKTT